MGSIIAAIFGSFFSSLWDKWFPPKTAADQKAEDLATSVKEADNANKISTEVDQKSRADVDNDLSKFVHRGE